MKTRESGMPDEEMWESFFNAEQVLRSLSLGEATENVVEFGCGYGTFTIPAARIARGTVYALDVEPEMVTRTADRARRASLKNVRVRQRDFVADGTGLPTESVDYAMLFNILHAECPDSLLQEAYRVLRPNGILAIMHWNHDPTTPRGPSMEIRPRSEQCRSWSETAGFVVAAAEPIDLPPYHYGLTLRRPRSERPFHSRLPEP
jgi:SAM-dependent methyltransferase